MFCSEHETTHVFLVGGNKRRLVTAFALSIKGLNWIGTRPVEEPYVLIGQITDQT